LLEGFADVSAWRQSLGLISVRFGQILREAMREMRGIPKGGVCILQGLGCFQTLVF